MLKRAEEIKSVETFRQRKQEKFSLRQVEADLRRSQLACEQLDSTVGISDPEREWFWLQEDGARQCDQEDSSEEDEREEDAIEVGPHRVIIFFAYT